MRSRAPAWSARGGGTANIPFMTTFHGTYNFNNRAKKAYNAVMAKGERVIAISEFIGRHVADEYDVPEDRIRVIPRGIDLETFNPYAVSAERMIQLSQAWRLPGESPVVMLPGRLTRWKVNVLIEPHGDGAVCGCCWWATTGRTDTGRTEPNRPHRRGEHHSPYGAMPRHGGSLHAGRRGRIRLNRPRSIRPRRRRGPRDGPPRDRQRSRWSLRNSHRRRNRLAGATRRRGCTGTGTADGVGNDR